MKLKCATLCLSLIISSVYFVKAQVNPLLLKLSDAPTENKPNLSTNPSPANYQAALASWKDISQVNKWIGEHFSYDLNRAKLLGENSSVREQTTIFSPEELYQTKKGVCLDLSRFAVETINQIDTTKHVQYLMIDFEPISIDGIVIKKHWLAVYKDTAGYHFFADSKRPTAEVSIHPTVEEFIIAYQSYRERKIVAWKILPSYKKKLMLKSYQQKQG